MAISDHLTNLIFSLTAMITFLGYMSDNSLPSLIVSASIGWSVGNSLSKLIIEVGNERSRKSR